MVERLSYDAWGKRRYPNGTDDPTGSITSQTSRGFTGHEELDSVGLVHMNGRVYDALVGRMISADPTVPVERDCAQVGVDRRNNTGAVCRIIGATQISFRLSSAGNNSLFADENSLFFEISSLLA